MQKNDKPTANTNILKETRNTKREKTQNKQQTKLTTKNTKK